MSDERAGRLAAWLARPGSTMVDLGCGRGAFARLVAAAGADVVGVDVDSDAIEHCRSLGPDVRWVEMDAARWDETVDAAACIGASHALGADPLALLRRTVVPGGRLVLGDVFWAAEPSSWCVATFGELAGGVEGLAAAVGGAGFEVVDVEASSPEEWEAFETGWCAGVEEVGTTEAIELAATRRSERLRYRDVLGFGWVRAT